MTTDDERPDLKDLDSSLFRFYSDISLLTREEGGLSFPDLSSFDCFFFSLSSFCFLKQAEVLWELFNLQYLRKSLSFGTDM